MLATPRPSAPLLWPLLPAPLGSEVLGRSLRSRRMYYLLRSAPSRLHARRNLDPFLPGVVPSGSSHVLSCSALIFPQVSLLFRTALAQSIRTTDARRRRDKRHSFLFRLMIRRRRHSMLLVLATFDWLWSALFASVCGRESNGGSRYVLFLLALLLLL